MTKAVDPSTLDLEGLKALALSLKIDSMGTLNVLKDRVIRQLKANGTWNPTDKKKRSKKKVKHLERVELKESETDANSNDVIIEIVPEKLLIDGDMGQQFTDLLDRFKERTLRRIDQDEDQVVLNTTVPDEEDDEENQLDPQQVIQSKKKLKKASRLTVAQLKQLVSKPEVVEVFRYILSHTVGRCHFFRSSITSHIKIYSEHYSSSRSLEQEERIPIRKKRIRKATV